MINIKRSILTLFSLILCLPLLGCGKNAQSAVTPEPMVTITPAPTPKPAQGGEIVIPMPRNPFRTENSSSANPLLVNTEELRIMYLLVYEPLLRCDQNNRIMPSLAEKWSVDDTGRVWTIILRENVVWHADGEFLTADDVIYTIDQLKAYRDKSFYGSQTDAIDAYEKVNDRTLTITMKSAGASSLYSLVFPVVSSRETEGMNGTGPYKLKSNGETMVELEVNPQWWRQTPYIQTVRCLARENNDVALSSYEAGQLNFVPTSNVSAGKYREAGATDVLDIMTQDAEILLVNHTNPILRDIEVRQAIAYALDRSAIVSNVYMNRATVVDVPVPPDSFLYDAASKVYDHNSAKAEALLASAGWTQKNEDGILVKDGRELRLTLLVSESTESTYRKNAATMVASQLLGLGIYVEVETARLTIGEEGEFETRLKAGEFGLALAGFNMDRDGDLSYYLSREGIRNYGRYQTSGKMEEAMKAAKAAIEEKDMRETHSTLQKAIVDELPFITLCFRMSSIIHSAEIKNMADVRSPDIMRTISSWYMKTAE